MPHPSLTSTRTWSWTGVPNLKANENCARKRLLENQSVPLLAQEKENKRRQWRTIQSNFLTICMTTTMAWIPLAVLRSPPSMTPRLILLLRTIPRDRSCCHQAVFHRRLHQRWIQLYYIRKCWYFELRFARSTPMPTNSEYLFQLRAKGNLTDENDVLNDTTLQTLSAMCPTGAFLLSCNYSMFNSSISFTRLSFVQDCIRLWNGRSYRKCPVGKIWPTFLAAMYPAQKGCYEVCTSYISAKQIDELASLNSARKTVPQIADPAALLHSRYDFQPAGVPSSKPSSTTATAHRSKFKPAMPSWFSLVIYISYDIRFVNAHLTFMH